MTIALPPVDVKTRVAGVSATAYCLRTCRLHDCLYTRHLLRLAVACTRQLSLSSGALYKGTRGMVNACAHRSSAADTPQPAGYLPPCGHAARKHSMVWEKLLQFFHRNDEEKDRISDPPRKKGTCHVYFHASTHLCRSGSGVGYARLGALRPARYPSAAAAAVVSQGGGAAGFPQTLTADAAGRCRSSRDRVNRITAWRSSSFPSVTLRVLPAAAPARPSVT
jgi:hypothetical protein